MAANYFIKLDLNWRDDAKVMDFEDRHGKASLVDVIGLYCLMAEFEGCIDLGNRGQRLRCEAALKKKGKALDKFLADAAECGIVNPEWLAAGRVGNERSVHDYRCRRSRADAAGVASEAAAAKRRKARAERDGASVTDTVTDGGNG